MLDQTTLRPDSDLIATINGLRLRYRVTGTGPPLVIQAPGWGIGSRAYERTLAGLADDFTVISYDTRGSGGSERPARPEDVTIANMVEDLEALRIHLGLASFAVIGHSHGGSIAVAYAARYGRHLSHLVLLDTPASDAAVQADLERMLPVLAEREEMAAAAETFMSEISTFATDEQMAAILQGIMPLYFLDGEKCAMFVRALVDSSPSSWAYNAISTDATYTQFDVQSGPATIDVSTLILVGRHDFICSPVQARMLHEAIPGSQLVVFERSGHFPWIEEPDAFFSTVRDFLLPAPEQG